MNVILIYNDMIEHKPYELQKVKNESRSAHYGVQFLTVIVSFTGNLGRIAGSLYPWMCIEDVFGHLWDLKHV